MIGRVGAFLYFFLFVGLVALTFGLFWCLSPYLVYFYGACMALMAARFVFKLDDRLTRYAMRIMISIDQHWQVVFAPLLNLGVTTRHRFGNPDETASSVVGKNLQATNGRHWILIELLLSVILEGGRPHAIPSIEADE